MSVRVHDLAKQCGLSIKEMIEKLHGMNYPVKSHSSTVDKITAESIQKEHGYVPPAPAPPAPPPPPPPPPVVEVKIVAAAPVVAPKPVEPPRPQPVVLAAPQRPTLPRIPAAIVTYRPPNAPYGPPPTTAKPVAKQVVPPTRIPAAPRHVPAPLTVAPIEPAFTIDAEGRKVIQMKPPVVVSDLARRISLKPHLLLKELMELNIYANLNETLNEEVARKICEQHGFVFELEKRERGAGVIHAPPKKIEVLEQGVKVEDLQSRPPVVTVMGHVDHGKTSLLDAIRKTDVAAHESGGITQHIGASTVMTADGKAITFLDTPGHAAFTKMRARGANVTDIVVLVVAADDGIMPQTLEAIHHAKAAQVPIIVAVNKCDLPAANPDRVKKQLQEHGLQSESWGGDTITVDVSAITKKGIDTLLEMILLQAEMLELKASPKPPAKGNVVEAQFEPGMGPTATVLVRKGSLRIGDAIVCGPHWGKIRALVNDKGQRIKEAAPSTPVKIVGLSGLPEAGTEFTAMKTEKEARALSEQRQLEERAMATTAAAPRHTKLEDILSTLEDGKKKTLGIVLKVDVQGSLEAIADALGKLKSDKIELDVIHGAVGSVNENDVLLASASDAVIIGFRVKTESGVTDMAKREDIQIKLYTVIYELIDQIEEAMEGLLEPEAREVIVGHAEVRKVFALSKGPPVAGCIVSDGRIARGGRVRLLRRKAVQYEGKIAGLRHFQDDVKEVKTGAECGVRLDNFTDYQPGDVIECYTVEKVAATL